MATMKEIARLAGVSVAAVSYVLNGSKRLKPETEKRVREAMERTGYQPNTVARSLRRNRTGLIGVLAEDVRGMPVPAILDGAGEALERAGYRTLLCNLRLLTELNNQFELFSRHLDDVRRAITLMEAARVEGMLYVAMHDRRVEGVRSARPRAFAYALTDGPSDCVLYDNAGGAREATLALTARGRGRIAALAGHAASPVVASRLAGFRRALRESGAAEAGLYWGDWSPESGALGCEALLSGRPDAIFAMNDAMAAGCYQTLRRHSLRVPEDVSVVGFDGLDFSALLEPPLTTVALPTREIGRKAAELLLARLTDPDRPPKTVTLPCRMLWRGSVAENAKENA